MYIYIYRLVHTYNTIIPRIIAFDPQKVILSLEAKVEKDEAPPAEVGKLCHQTRKLGDAV